MLRSRAFFVSTETTVPTGRYTFTMEVRDRILDTAMAMVVQEGVGGVTIDRVAAEAGMSKGGVFYHFKNKEALLTAMAEKIIAEFEEECDNRMAAGATMIEATVEGAFSQDLRQKNRIAALITCCTSDPTFGHRFREKYTEWVHDLALKGGVDAGTARVIATSIDGYYITEVLGVSRMSQDEICLLKERLLDLARPSAKMELAQLFQYALAKAESIG